MVILSLRAKLEFGDRADLHADARSRHTFQAAWEGNLESVCLGFIGVRIKVPFNEP